MGRLLPCEHLVNAGPSSISSSECGARTDVIGGRIIKCDVMADAASRVGQAFQQQYCLVSMIHLAGLSCAALLAWLYKFHAKFTTPHRV